MKACPYCQGGTFSQTLEHEAGMAVSAAGGGYPKYSSTRIHALEKENEALRAERYRLALHVSRLTHLIALDGITRRGVKQ